MTSEIRPGHGRVSGGATVAAGMMAMNVALYGFNVLAARGLLPKEFGALTALFGIILVGNVASLGLQAATARRIAVEPERAGDIISVTIRVTVSTAALVSGVIAASTVALTPLLKLDSYWPVVLCGATLFPLTVMGAQSGIAQGTSRWRSLTAIYIANGVGRLAVGAAAIAIHPGVDSVMIGIALGAWLPVLAGSHLVFLQRSSRALISRRGLVREAALGTHALLAYFVLSNADSLIARNLFGTHQSGLYASGLIIAKGALFLPQFVSVVFFPTLARAESLLARRKAALLVAAFGALTVLLTAVLPRLALIFVGGDKYEAIMSRLWLFALAGSALAIVHLLTFDALARHAHGIAVMLWVAVAAVFACAYGFNVGITGLVITMAAVAAVLATIVWFAPAKTTRIITPTR